MGKRGTGRRIAMQAIYEAQVGGVPIDKALENIFESEKFIEETKEFAKTLANGAWGAREKTDKIIGELSSEWSLERIADVDKSILRLAIFELKNMKETPRSVVINEAIELAKRFSGEESSKFINGILGALIKTESL